MSREGSTVSNEFFHDNTRSRRKLDECHDSFRGTRGCPVVPRRAWSCPSLRSQEALDRLGRFFAWVWRGGGWRGAFGWSRFETIDTSPRSGNNPIVDFRSKRSRAKARLFVSVVFSCPGCCVVTRLRSRLVTRSVARSLGQSVRFCLGALHVSVILKNVLSRARKSVVIILVMMYLMSSSFVSYGVYNVYFFFYFQVLLAE